MLIKNFNQFNLRAGKHAVLKYRRTTSSHNSRKWRLRNNHLIAFICYSFKSADIESVGAEHSVSTLILSSFFFFKVSYQFDCQISILGARLAPGWIALNTCFVSLSYIWFVHQVWKALCMNVSLNNGCDIPLPPTYNRVLIRRISKYYWYYSLQVLYALSDGDSYRQNVWAGRKKAAVTRRTPVTLSEHGRTDVERKIESDISHTFLRCLGNKVIKLNKETAERTKDSYFI